jgi:predicted AAA+ superfamily ATPase
MMLTDTRHPRGWWSQPLAVHARDDPAGSVEHDGLLVIDEVQLAPELFRSIKVAVDTDPRPGPALSRTSTLRKRDYLDRVVRGGYPEAVRRSPRRRAAFFDSYLPTSLNAMSKN